MKKLTTLLLALVACAGTMFASDTQVDGIWYKFNNGNLTAEVTYQGADYTSYSNRYSGEVVIPSSVTYNAQTYTVTSIGTSAFDACTGLTSVTIPNSVTSIGSWAFYDCSSLTSVIIGNSVTSIGGSAFSGCSGLTSVTIPNSVTSIGSSAFYNVPNIVYSGSATGSPWGAKSVNGYVDGYLVYSDDTKTTLITCSSSAQGEIVIPNSVTSIGSSAFNGCTGLTSVTIPNSVTSIGTSAFERCTGLTSVTIPNSVTSIGGSAFYNCRGLTSVTIPNSVTSIGSEAFSGCNNITSVVWNAKNGSGYNFGSQVESFTFGDEVEVIPASICSGMNNLTSLTIPNSVTSIESFAFYGCSSLTSLTMGNSVASIGDYAFRYCSALSSVEAPAVFFDIQESQWSYYTKILSQVTVNGGELTENALQFIKRSYKTLRVMDVSEATNTEFADETFSGYYNLTNLKLPESLTSISYMMAAGCKNLESITIPESVEEIGQSAFEDCRSITSVDFGENPALTMIGSWAFYNCHELANIDIPEGVTEIGKAAFYGCAYAQAAHLPASLQYIGDNGFALCSKLTEMTVDAVTPPEVENKTFYEVSTEAPIYVPDQSVSAYKSHPVWSRLNIVGRNDIPTAIGDVQSNSQLPTANSQKILSNGQILILRNGNTYTIDGKKVEN